VAVNSEKRRVKSGLQLVCFDGTTGEAVGFEVYDHEDIAKVLSDAENVFGKPTFFREYFLCEV